MGDRGTRPLAHAGRRSAGLGGNGRAWPRTHAVGVRARGEWAIWLVAVHRRFLMMRKYTCFNRQVPLPIH